MNVRNRTDPRIALWLCSNNCGRSPNPSRDLMALGILAGWCRGHLFARCRFMAATYRAGGRLRETVLHPGYQEANACDQRCRAQGHYEKGSFAVGLKVVVVHR
jgi:hypothetical protein